MPKNLIPYVLDFTGMTMNTTMSNDKLAPNQFVEIKNVDVSLGGNVRKRYGIGNLSTNASPNVPETRINAIASAFLAPAHSLTIADNVLLADTTGYYQALTLSPWGTCLSSLIAITASDALGWHIAWTIDNSGDPRAVFSLVSSGAFAIEGITGTGVELGSGTFTAAGCSEYFQDKTFVANTVEGSPAVNQSDRLRWTITGAYDTWTGTGSGYFDLRHPGGGTGTYSQSIRGLRVYRNTLWIGFQSALYALTGTSSGTYGKRHILSVNGIIGSTMFATKDFLFWIDYDGIWQFNGSSAINVVLFVMLERWKDLSLPNDIMVATASWDDMLQVYMVYFPAVQELWRYHYLTGQWEIWTFSCTDAIRCISPPIQKFGEKFTTFALGTATNGRVFRMKSSLVADDTTAITTSVKTGHIRLGELNGGKPGDRFHLHYLDLEVAEQNTAAIVKATFTIDGTAQTTASLTITDAGATTETFPTAYDGTGGSRIDFSGITLVGKYLQLELKDDDLDSRCDIRRATLWYERLDG